MTAVYNATGGSLLLAVLMHLAFNVAFELPVAPLETQMAILAGLYFGLALLVVLIAGPGRLSRSNRRPEG